MDDLSTLGALGRWLRNNGLDIQIVGRGKRWGVFLYAQRCTGEVAEGFGYGPSLLGALTAAVTMYETRHSVAKNRRKGETGRE